MADRTSADLFGGIFVMLAEKATKRDKEYALKIWPMTWEYDFHECQMDCDEELEKLGLARPGEDEGYPCCEYADAAGEFEKEE